MFERLGLYILDEIKNFYPRKFILKISFKLGQKICFFAGLHGATLENFE